MAEYTALILSPNQPDRAQLLEDRLRAAVTELGLAPEHLALPDVGSFASDHVDGPVAAVYFGGAARDESATRIATEFVRRGRPILPVVFDSSGNLDGYTHQVPSALAGVNGYADDGSERAIDTMANTVLEALGLVRARRRVFISYRLKESNGVALQLATALHAAGYLVFLDTQSFEPGAIFQRALWDAMADTDLVLLLDTEATLDSHWVAEEFALANELGVTVLHIVWPGHTRPRVTELSEVMRLSQDDFWATAGAGERDGKIRMEAIDRILGMVERLRAAAFASRRQRLVEGFVQRVRRTEGKVHLNPGGYLHVERRSGRDAIIVPVIGALESMLVEDAALAHAERPVEIRVLYRARGMHARRVQHLNWLDTHLPIKLLELEAVPGWLVTP